MTEQAAPGREGRVGPFMTFVERERPDGVIARWGSRRHRKHQVGATTSGSTWWAPQARGWWIAALFAVGSVLFAVGAVPRYASVVGIRIDSVTFFVGSLFFTTAGFLSYREAVDAGPPDPDGARRRFFVYQPSRIDWLATAVQLAGTVFFNVSTAYATQSNLSAATAHQHVWRPNTLGSICFLVASALAWFEVCHGWTAWRPLSLSWWITLLNLLGSIAFGISATAGYISSSTGDVRNAERANTGTLIGALCFLAGALLLMPERTSDRSVEMPVTPARPAN
jgi:hypothetical protein